jgi:hypothetical protein
MRKFGNDHPNPFAGATVDSGAGTPELMAASLDKVFFFADDAMADSCGLHDLQSVFRLAIKTYVGEGNVESRNAVQLLHALWTLQDTL